MATDGSAGSLPGFGIEITMISFHETGTFPGAHLSLTNSRNKYELPLGKCLILLVRCLIGCDGRSPLSLRITFQTDLIEELQLLFET